MHDTDRTLAELTALDGEAEADLESDGEYEDQYEEENFESPSDFEFQPEQGFEDLENLGMSSSGLDQEADFEAGETLEAESGFEPETLFEDETQFEDESSYAAETGSEGEQDFEDEFEDEGAPTMAEEASEAELAAELLEVQSEDELEYFLGGLVKKVAKRLGQAIKSPLGQQVVALLKQAARKALPAAGAAIGGALGGPAGVALGGNITARIGKLFGLELEGLAAEDQEFETAKGFIRFARQAAQEAAQMPPELDPQTAARRAVVYAARQYAPGLLATISPSPAVGVSQYAPRDASGRWVRVARNQVVLYGI
jgi:hypothetical protein